MAAPMRGNLTYVCLKRKAFYVHCTQKLDSNKVQPYISRYFNRCQVCSFRNDASDSPKKLILKNRKRRPGASLLNSETLTARKNTTLSRVWSNVSLIKSYTTDTRSDKTFRDKIKSGPGLGDFISASILQEGTKDQFASDSKLQQDLEVENDSIPYLNPDVLQGRNRNVYFETYGCQMNVNDTEIAWSILQKHGFQKVKDIAEADVALMVTCSIRENAEKKIWNRLEHFQHLKNKRRKTKQPDLKIGLLGCMAERLKRKIVERSKIVDVVAGPDSYRDLPRLLSQTDSGQAAINVMLSMDETYADVIPVRMNQESKSAFVSIMRGCDNMCSYCIVPFTRGRERSRPITSILEEVRSLSGQGVKEVTILGQNVNSYRDTSESSYYGVGDIADDSTPMAKGFSTIYKNKKGGLRFSYLLEKVAEIDPEMRIRFTSPHPKDFPDEVLHVIKDNPNICNQLHLPAQSGNTDVLSRMRRGYTREAYLELVENVQRTLPGVSLSSDFIAGFCGETEAEHEDTLSLLRLIKYNYAFLFAYSMRQKTHAYHKMKDDVPEDVKIRRLTEIIDLSRKGMAEMNAQQIGSQQLVLIEGKSKKSADYLAGRNDGNIKVIIPGNALAVEEGSKVTRPMQPGDYVVVKVTDSTSQILKGIPLYHTTLQGYAMQMDLANDSKRDYQRAAEQC